MMFEKWRLQNKKHVENNYLDRHIEDYLLDRISHIESSVRSKGKIISFKGYESGINHDNIPFMCPFIILQDANDLKLSEQNVFNGLIYNISNDICAQFQGHIFNNGMVFAETNYDNSLNLFSRDKFGSQRLHIDFKDRNYTLYDAVLRDEYYRGNSYHPPRTMRFVGKDYDNLFSSHVSLITMKRIDDQKLK